VYYSRIYYSYHCGVLSASF